MDPDRSAAFERGTYLDSYPHPYGGQGGYGDDYAKAHEELYKKKFPETTVKHAGITDITPRSCSIVWRAPPSFTRARPQFHG